MIYVICSDKVYENMRDITIQLHILKNHTYTLIESTKNTLEKYNVYLVKLGIDNELYVCTTRYPVGKLMMHLGITNYTHITTQLPGKSTKLLAVCVKGGEVFYAKSHLALINEHVLTNHDILGTLYTDNNLIIEINEIGEVVYRHSDNCSNTVYVYSASGYLDMDSLSNLLGTQVKLENFSTTHKLYE